MTVLDLAESLTEDEMAELVDGIFQARVGQAREERLTELIEDAPPTLREDAVAENPAFADLERVLGLMPSEPPPEAPPGEAAIRERTQAEREARDAVEALIEGNMDDADVLRGLARALDDLDAAASGLLSQERLQQLSDADREELARAAQEAARRAEGVELGDFPALERALRRRGGRDATYFENAAAELRGDRELDTLQRQDVEPATLRDLREFHPDVLEAAIERAEANAAALRGEAPEEEQDFVDTGGIRPGEITERAISARVRQLVPAEERRRDPITDEPFQANPALERNFLEWVINVKGDTDRFNRHYFESSPERRRREFIAMQAWARLQVKAGNATVQSAEQAGLPSSWFSGLGNG